jgi:hypothetical protein
MVKLLEKLFLYSGESGYTRVKLQSTLTLTSYVPGIASNCSASSTSGFLTSLKWWGVLDGMQWVTNFTILFLVAHALLQLGPNAHGDTSPFRTLDRR